MLPLVRVTGVVIGILGFAAIPFNAVKADGLQLTLKTIACFFAGAILLFAAFFGKYPWDRSGAKSRGEMK